MWKCILFSELDSLHYIRLVVATPFGACINCGVATACAYSCQNVAFLDCYIIVGAVCPPASRDVACDMYNVWWLQAGVRVMHIAMCNGLSVCVYSQRCFSFVVLDMEADPTRLRCLFVPSQTLTNLQDARGAMTTELPNLLASLSPAQRAQWMQIVAAVITNVDLILDGVTTADIRWSDPMSDIADTEEESSESSSSD